MADRLIYMSTDAVLKVLCQSGALIKWEAELDDDESPQRRIYLAPDVHAWLNPPEGSKKSDVKYAAGVRRFLKGFIVGENFDDVIKLKNLDVDEFDDPDQGIWAIRVQREPKTRIFGGFPHENVFVGTHVYLRSELPKKKWTNEKSKVLTQWSGRYKALVGDAEKQVVGMLPRLRNRTRAQLTSNTKGRRNG
ncbi:hypothetical protein MKK68_20850 [Methylobacterium sp. E-016]|uniref:hypothetical protein n=1 Tax=Methylobacterium sp. E-016 TaxID=2836556 RepID=UPI001FBC13A6|nr:hypothetical protein [Methylobacterium sp. E-016]MCJ2078063.1 hypothetical protein [Methylobacterium sp. E-016]